MTLEEAKLLKLGDYVKLSIPNKSDEYYMVTGIKDIFKLRRVGDKKLLKTLDLEDFSTLRTD